MVSGFANGSALFERLERTGEEAITTPVDTA
jgi:hypothetical protein